MKGLFIQIFIIYPKPSILNPKLSTWIPQLQVIFCSPRTPDPKPSSTNINQDQLPTHHHSAGDRLTDLWIRFQDDFENTLCDNIANPEPLTPTPYPEMKPGTAIHKQQTAVPQLADCE